MKGIIDTSKPIQSYKVLMSELSGYYLTVAAETPEQAMEYGNNPAIRKNYKMSEIMVVETAVVSAELVTKQSMQSYKAIVLVFLIEEKKKIRSLLNFKDRFYHG